MSINQKSGRQTFRRRFVSGSLFVSPCPPECNFQSETKIEPDLRLQAFQLYRPILAAMKGEALHNLYVINRTVDVSLYWGSHKLYSLLLLFKYRLHLWGAGDVSIATTHCISWGRWVPGFGKWIRHWSWASFFQLEIRFEIKRSRLFYTFHPRFFFDHMLEHSEVLHLNNTANDPQP